MASDLSDCNIDAAENAALSRSREKVQLVVESDERPSLAALEKVPSNRPAYAEWALERAGGHGRFQFRYHLYLGILPHLLSGLSIMSHIFVTMPPVLVATGKAMQARDCARPRQELVFVASITSVASEFDLLCQFKFGVTLLVTFFFSCFCHRSSSCWDVCRQAWSQICFMRLFGHIATWHAVGMAVSVILLLRTCAPADWCWDWWAQSGGLCLVCGADWEAKSLNSDCDHRLWLFCWSCVAVPDVLHATFVAGALLHDFYSWHANPPADLSAP